MDTERTFVVATDYTRKFEYCARSHIFALPQPGEEKTSNNAEPAVSNQAGKTVQTPSFGIFLASAFCRKCRMRHLRHTFAVHRLTEWYKTGADVQIFLPALSTYLGHVDLRSTQCYLTMTPELLTEANRRFQAYVYGGRHE
jgi:hypothetical protein